MQTIGDVMSAPVIMVDCADDLEHAAELMKERSVHHLVITDRGRVIGVLSDRDLYRLEARKRVTPQVLSVAEAMTPDPPMVDVDDPLSEIAALMADSGSDAVVVMRGRAPVGVFTTTDALRLLAARGPANVSPEPTTSSGRDLEPDQEVPR